jgi:hypothetical protein
MAGADFHPDVIVLWAQLAKDASAPPGVAEEVLS